MRKVKTLAICLPEDQIEQVKRVAHLQGRSVSQAISRLLQVALLHSNLEELVRSLPEEVKDNE